MNNLSEYLCDTLTDEEKRDLALELSMSAMAKEELPPYTMEEINAMIEESERQIASGRYITDIGDQITGSPIIKSSIRLVKVLSQNMDLK